jgi:hypothetical protein
MHPEQGIEKVGEETIQLNLSGHMYAHLYCESHGFGSGRCETCDAAGEIVTLRRGMLK